MYEPELAASRPKPRQGAVLQQPFPVPIASLTEIKASNSIWRWYTGVWDDRLKCVQVKEEQGSNLWKMGFFGIPMTQEEEEMEEEEPTEQEDMIEIEDMEPAVVLRGEKKEKSAVRTRDKEACHLKNKKKKQMSNRDESQASSSGAAIGTVQLQDYEAYFLSYALGCLLVVSDGAELNLDQMWATYVISRPRFPLLYAAYHHFRAKGWVVRPGAHFGTDFLLYKNGPPFYHAAYSVKVVASEGELTWQELAGLNRVTECASKELILATVSGLPSEEEHFEQLVLSPESLKDMKVKEVLVRRWVPSQEREDW